MLTPNTSSAEGCLAMLGAPFGEGESWDSTHVHEGAAFSVPCGLFVLEAQDALMNFLCVFIGAIFETEVKDIQSKPDSDRAFEDCKRWNKATTGQVKLEGREEWLSIDHA